MHRNRTLPTARTTGRTATALAPAITLGLVVAASGLSPAAAAEDDEVVLPSRVANPIKRAEHAADQVIISIDGRRWRAAKRSAPAISANTHRAHRAAVRQISAPPADPESETTSGPDSVVAVLTLEQGLVTQVSGAFDGLRRPKVARRLAAAIRSVQTDRRALLVRVTGLPPEGAGADYADGMADTVDGYTDEVTSLREALAVDKLRPVSRRALRQALTRSRHDQAVVTAAFGGGE